MTELERCPFCGNRAAEAVLDPEQGYKWGAMECGCCGAKGPEVRTGYAMDEAFIKSASETWNRRAQPEGMVSIAAADLRSLYQAVIDAGEEGLAYHAEPMQRARQALEHGEG